MDYSRLENLHDLLHNHNLLNSKIIEFIDFYETGGMDKLDALGCILYKFDLLSVKNLNDLLSQHDLIRPGHISLIIKFFNAASYGEDFEKNSGNQEMINSAIDLIKNFNLDEPKGRKSARSNLFKEPEESMDNIEDQSHKHKF